MDTLPKEQTRRELSPQLVSILSTEHYNLQNGRSSTIADASGRANLFISAVSTTLVALAFIGQASNFGTPFFVFSLILFPTLGFLGLVTFERTLQLAIEDIHYARGMSRFRHLFLEHAPEMQPYFTLPTSDDVEATLEGVGMKATYMQILMGTPGTVAVLTSVIAGTFAGLLLYALFTHSLPLCAGVGIICFLVSVGFCLWYHYRKVLRATQHLPTLFPDPTKAS